MRFRFQWLAKFGFYRGQDLLVGIALLRLRFGDSNGGRRFLHLHFDRRFGCGFNRFYFCGRGRSGNRRPDNRRSFGSGRSRDRCGDGTHGTLVPAVGKPLRAFAGAAAFVTGRAAIILPLARAVAKTFAFRRAVGSVRAFVFLGARRARGSFLAAFQ